MALYEQSLALNETIGDVQGKAATLIQMATIYPGNRARWSRPWPL